MANFRKCFALLTVLCIFLIPDSFASTINRKSPRVQDNRGVRNQKKRDIDGAPISDVPLNLSNDDPQVKLYAEKGVEKLKISAVGVSDAVLKEIVDAIYFPPPGKIIYDVFIRVESKLLKNPILECTVNAWREPDAEPSISIDCGEIELALPSKPSVDDPLVKSYAVVGVQKLAETSTGPAAPVLKEVLEATAFPADDKLAYVIKIKVGSKQNEDSQECRVNVPRGNDVDPVIVECDQVRKKRGDDSKPQLANLRLKAKFRVRDDERAGKVHQKRAVNDEPENTGWPVRLNNDDPRAIRYAEKGVEQLLMNSSIGLTEASLGQVLDAIYFPPPGKLLYDLYVIVESKQLKYSRHECIVNAWRQRGAEPSVTLDCDKIDLADVDDDKDD